MKSYRLAALLMLVSLGAFAQEPPKALRIGTVDFVSQLEGIPAVEAMIREAFSIHGYRMDLSFYPGKRIIAQLNNGLLDGDLFRTINLARGFENVVRVDEPLVGSCGLFLKVSEKPVDLSNLSQATRMGIIHGAPGISAMLRDKYPHAKLTFFKKLEQGVDMLEHDRLDLLVIISGQESYVKRVQRKKLVLAGGVVFSPFYIHLHSRHKQLALDLAPTLRRLKQDVEMTLCDQEILTQRLANINESKPTL